MDVYCTGSMGIGFEYMGMVDLDWRFNSSPCTCFAITSSKYLSRNKILSDNFLSFMMMSYGRGIWWLSCGVS